MASPTEQLADSQPCPGGSLTASVVMPTHGRRTSLLRVLTALANQKTARDAFEVIVVCDGDIDGSADACRRLAPSVPYALRILEQTNAGPATARNQGVHAAMGELIIFLDDDVIPDPLLIATHLAAHAGRSGTASIGPLLLPADEKLSLWGAWEQRMLNRQYTAMQEGKWQATYRQFYTGNAAVRKLDILVAGGFDSSFKRAEDIELALRLRERGTTFVFLPEARGIHYVQRSFSAWLRVPAAYGAADMAMAKAGRPWVLVTSAQEFRWRRPAMRFLTLLWAGRSASKGIVFCLGSLVRLANHLHLSFVGNPLCSVIFNLEYYAGLATALGGRNELLRLLREQSTSNVLDSRPG